MEITVTGTRRTVCVTGGTGYLGSWLVMKLLQQRYSVNTTVRSHKGTDFLKNLPGASERLRIFEADLNQPDSFRPSIEGCVGVFLVAHPMNYDKKLTEEAATKLSVSATLGILQACLDSKTVKRVVYTSSASSVMYGNKNSSIVVADESTWSDLDLVRETNPLLASYTITKTLTERAALEFAENNGLEFVSILPTWIHGPFINPGCPSSVYALMSMFLGDPEQYKYLSYMDLVHVDDLASAHIFLFECANDPKGRYICSATGITAEKLFEFLGTKYPEYEIASPRGVGDMGADLQGCKVSSKKLVETGFKFKYGLGEMYDEAMKSCTRLGLL